MQELGLSGFFLSSGSLSGNLAGLFLLNDLHHRGGSGFGMLRLHSEVAKNGVVETEAVFDLEDRLMAALDVEEHIVRFSIG